MRQRRTDFVAWEGPSSIDGAPVACIVSGVKTPSRNIKTGVMWQVWYLRQDIHPFEAVKTSADVSICGTCPLRGIGDGVLRSCYVQPQEAASAIWKKYRDGGYPRLTPEQWRPWLRGQGVRLGAYGEPTVTPASVAYNLVDGARMHTGYTHRWAELSLAGRAEVWRQILSASVETDEDVFHAQRLGWRPFMALPEGQSVPDGAFLCPAEREDNPLTCLQCGACAGTKSGSRTATAAFPYTPMHGAGRKNYTRMKEMEDATV